MTRSLWPRLVAVCAVIAPAARADPGPRNLSLFGPREDLPWHRHDALWQLTGNEYTWNKPKPFKDDKGLSQEAYVIPQRPGKNLVRYFDFHWRDFDFLDDDGSAGIRFYFYDREYPVARIAAGLVRQSWAYLTDRFNYKPSFKVPYILYNTYREFLETNVFEVQEGTLGVTSPQDLRMTLSYSGDRQLFTEVSTHEMVHQFQIQKVAERAASAGLDSPIGAFPLWFIEGLAEYYAHGQTIDPETDMFLRDVVLNPNGEIGYDIPSLEEDRPYAWVYTYKYGQARLVFLSETYGEKVIQAVLDQSPRLAGGGARRGGDPGGPGGGGPGGFMGLLARIAGEQPQQMNARWQEWMRKRAYSTYLQSKQDLPDVTELRLPDELDWFVSSKDGNMIFYRGVERDTGRAKLVLIDRRDPTSNRQIAIDQHPGTESLHIVFKSVMAVCDTGIAWFALDGESDVLHFRSVNRVVRGIGSGPAPQSTAAPMRGAPGRGRPPPSPFAGIDATGARAPVDLRLGPDIGYKVVRDGVIEAGDPTFSPDCSRLAFYGLDRDGKSDIYTLNLREPDAHARRLTEDLYAERDLSWGEEGIIYAGDATESGRFNLFRIDPDTGTRVRLTDAPVNQRHPLALDGGAVLFDSDAGGKSDLWFLQDGRIKRLTDFTTALSHPGLSPNGAYGVAWYGARFRMFEVPTSEMLSADEQDAIPPSYASTLDQPLPFPDEPIPQNASEYAALNLGKNWRLEGGGAAIGGVGVGLAPVGGGGVIFSDVLRDRSFLANLAVYGSFDLTDALAFYVDRSNRMVYGLGLFHTFQQGRVTNFSGSNCTFPPQTQPAPPCQVFYLQRMFGAQGLLSYPFSTFSRVDALLRVQGMNRSLLDNGILDSAGFPTLLPISAVNSIIGFDGEIESSLAYGWDTTRYGPGGAIGGSSVLLTVGLGFLPTQGSNGGFGYTQFDAIHTIRLFARTKITARAAMGYTQGNKFGRHFFLSSFDNLRGFRFNDFRLLGDAYYVGQTELAFPLDFLIRFAFFNGITGIVGLDFGGVVETTQAQQAYPGSAKLAAVAQGAWAERTMDYVLGVNFGLGPFELRVQFAHGIDIGGLVPERDSNGNPTWVPNISLHYAYF